VPEGLVAVTIPVDDARGVAGLISPGDHVAVLATVEDNANQISYTRVIVGGVQVLAVGQNTASSGATPSGVQGGGVVGAAESGSASASPPTVVTVAASAADAERIVYSVEVGSIWLALLPDKDHAVERGPGQHALSVFK
jgi:pilus assembly protein CpaB